VVDNRSGEEAGRTRPLRLGNALLGAWLGYRRRMDDELAGRGFTDRRFPDRLVLRMCSRPGDTTISQIGRGLGITRQGASKVVTGLSRRGYVTVTASPTSGREKIVRLTDRGAEYRAALRQAAQTIERQLRAEVGSEELESFCRMLDLLGGGERPLPGTYLRELSALSDLPGPS
jgi:DNA-binding MarR family transcriptional regulator